MSQVHQTLATGPVAASTRWGALGGFSHRMISSPDGVLALVAGLPGCGKSAFLQTCPDAYIFNFDPTSTTIPGEPGGAAPQPRALMWPGISPSGHTIDDDGSPFVLTWDAVESKINTLIALAKAKAPRPKLVAFDSLTSMIALLKSWIPPNAGTLKMADGPRTLWKEIDGRAGWDYLYDRIIQIFQTLRAHGYGVYVIGHIVNSKIPLGDDRMVVIPELTVTDNFWKRLYPWFEIILICQASNEIVSVPDPNWRPDPRFPLAKPRIITSEKRRVRLTTGGNDYAGITKIRVPLTTVLLEPASEAWSVFSKAYQDAASRGTLEPSEIVPAPKS